MSPEYLKRFIERPAEVHPQTTMPDMLAAVPATKRPKVAEAITHFLVAQAPTAFQTGRVDASNAATGRDLYHTIGCVACHSPRDRNGKETTRKAAVPLGHVTAKYSLPALSAFLYQPLHARPSGRMPDMKLTKTEAGQIASYLLSADPTPRA